MARGEALAYEPGIDGLRALAVGVVLVFHGGFAWAAGGFLGVSVFFTLSGFLITRLLLDEHGRAGRISLTRFWGRRLRRLSPASLLCLLAVLVVSPWWSDALQRRALRTDVWSAATYWANWRFVAGDRSYAELFAAPSPVLHFWSLAIEEQFYLIYPIVVVAVVRLGRARPRLALAAVLSTLLVASATAGRLTSDHDLIYYGAHIRAGELLVGALAALGAPWLTRHFGQWLGWVGLGAIVGIVVLSWRSDIGSPWLYDGRLVLFAVVSAAGVVGVTVGGPARALLGRRPFVAAGRVSYGLYLFHWPIFLLLDERRIGWGRGPLFALRLTVTLAVSIVSFVLIEQPVRLRRALPRPRVALAGFAAALGVVVAVAPLSRPGSSAATASAEIPGGVVVFERPATTTSAVTAPAPTTTPEPASTVPAPMIVGFAGADLSVRARLVGLDGIDVIDLLPVGCPLVSEERHPGCPVARDTMQRMMPAIDPVLVVLTLATQDRAALDVADPDERLRRASQMAQNVRRSAEGALSGGTQVLILDTSGLRDPLSVGLEQLALAHPEVTVIGSAGLRAAVIAHLGPIRAPIVAEPGVASTGAPEGAGDLEALVIGDSTSFELAAALARQGDLTVVWGGGANCPLVDVADLRWFDGAQWPMDECPNVDAGWPATIADVRPDVVLVVASLAEQSEHRYPGSSAWHVVGDPAFTEAHDSMMLDLLELVAPLGSLVLVANAPPILAGSFVDSEMADADRLSAWNEQIRRWDEQWLPVSTVDYAGAVAHVEADGSQRDDGLHLRPAAADAVAAELAPVVTARAAELRAALAEAGCRVGTPPTLVIARCAQTNAPGLNISPG